MCSLWRGNITSQIKHTNIYVPRDRKGNINTQKLQRPVLEIKNINKHAKWYSLYLYLPEYASTITVLSCKKYQKVFPTAKKLGNILGADIIRT